VDQESLLLRAAALEDKLKESRAEQGQLENYKQVSQIFLVVLCYQAGQPLFIYSVFLSLTGQPMPLSGVQKMTWLGI